MKNFVLLFAITFAMFSCSEQGTNDKPIGGEAHFSAKGFTGSYIAYEKNGEIEMGVSDQELINAFNDYSAKLELGYKAVSYIIEEIDNKNYLRFFNEDESVSTVALLYAPNKLDNASQQKVVVGQTLCTTTDCANCCGCVPEGSYCTECGVNMLDCKRTTTG